MAIGTKCIQVFLSKTLGFPMKTCYNLVKKYPIPSSVTTLLFLMYMFLPLVCVCLICSVLVSALAAVIYRVFFRADLKGFENVKGYKNIVEKTPIVKGDDMSKNVSVSGDSQTTRRRNVNKKDREGYTHSSIEEKNVASSAGFGGDLVDKTAVAEENLKEVKEVQVDSADDRARPSLVDDSPQFSGVIAETEGEISDDSEDDQLNLGHVSDSEIERKARKSLEIKVRKALMSPARNYFGDRISITTERRNHFIANNPDTSPIPGSAPSVLLPMHNPLDILYDLHEEKNIQESFQSKNLADQYMDLMFCRHESFNLGAFCPIESRQDQTFHDFSFQPRPSERREYSRAVNKADKDAVDKIIERKSDQENEGPVNGDSADNYTIHEGHTSGRVFNSFYTQREEDESEVESEGERRQNLLENSNDGSTSSSSSEDYIPLCRAHKAELLRSLSSLARKDTDVARDDNDQETDVSYNTDRLLYEKTKGNSFFGEKNVSHAPSNSLASDLQVEVSEVSSPQSTTSNEKSSIFDDYFNKEAAAGCEDMWAGSSQLSGVYINESNSRGINEVDEQDFIDIGFSRINPNLYPNTSNLQPENVVQQDIISSHSQPSNLPDSIQGHTNDYKSEHPAASNSIDAPPTNDSEHLTKRVVAQASNSENFEEASPQEVNVAEKTVVHDNDGNEGFMYRKVIVPEALAEVSTPDEENYCKSLEDTNCTLNKHSDLKNLSKASAL